jgi:hypothetical protein
LLAPLHGSDWDAPALGDFYNQAFNGSVSLPVAGYDYNSGWISFCWRDSHPLEWQLASLHGHGRDNAHDRQITLSTARIHGSELDFKHNKAGVSAPAQKYPEIPRHSLPATLRMLGINPILSYSNGSRGLSVPGFSLFCLPRR